ncbi:L,D-transpeptidase [Streptomyces sp. NPDC001941]|uniref:L,D-transpeptidase n=1 Tax=Streptomyces sp. NPDC001941 TaxID=3154659 RepID=UPI003326A9BC
MPRPAQSLCGHLLVLTFALTALGTGSGAASAPLASVASTTTAPRPVPERELSPPFESDKKAPFCTAYTGPHQQQIERYLGLRADGRQSVADCRAVQKFQQSRRITPSIGYAGPVTYATTVLLRAQASADPRNACPKRAATVVCVDLTRQLLWAERGGRTVFTARPVRSGAKGYSTRTGWFRISWRHQDHWSTLYRSRMPYAQFFSGGQAFHAHDGSVYAPPGSHGCVNMRPADAKALWKQTRVGTSVYVFGRKPGT